PSASQPGGRYGATVAPGPGAAGYQAQPINSRPPPAPSADMPVTASDRCQVTRPTGYGPLGLGRPPVGRLAIRWVSGVTALPSGVSSGSGRGSLARPDAH